MPPTNDRYQRYAESLGEPVTDDLRAFVDGLDAPFIAPVLPDALARFTPSAHLRDQESRTMSLPPKEVLPANAPPLRADRSPRSRVSFGLVAALVLVIVVAGIFATKQAHLPPGSQGPQAVRTPTPMATATPSPTQILPPTKVYVRCLTISLQQPTSAFTNCAVVPSATRVPINSLVNFIYCYTADIPLPSALINKVTAPNGQSVYAPGTLQPGQPLCDDSGTHVDQKGQYTVQIYWNSGADAGGQTDPATDPTWQLQISAKFTVV